MASLFAPQPPHFTLPVFFNVDQVVGAAPATNNREDVLLVQFYLKFCGQTPTATTPPVLTEAMKKVRVTGSMDPATINAIQTLQSERKRATQNPTKIVDGRVSPARGYKYGSANWTIAVLNDMVQNRKTDVWPRIDKIPGCPPELTQMVFRTLVGKGFSK